MDPIRETGDSVLIDVLVQPRASRPRIGPRHGDRIKISVTAPPVDGAANAAVVELWARALHCARGQIEVDSGHSSRRKRIRIRGVSRAAVEEVIT